MRLLHPYVPSMFVVLEGRSSHAPRDRQRNVLQCWCEAIGRVGILHDSHKSANNVKEMNTPEPTFDIKPILHLAFNHEDSDRIKYLTLSK